MIFSRSSLAHWNIPGSQKGLAYVVGKQYSARRARTRYEGMAILYASPHFSCFFKSLTHTLQPNPLLCTALAAKRSWYSVPAYWARAHFVIAECISHSPFFQYHVHSRGRPSTPMRGRLSGLLHTYIVTKSTPKTEVVPILPLVLKTSLASIQPRTGLSAGC